MILGHIYLFVYRLSTFALGFFAPAMLKRRIKRGKEHPTRYREKLGFPSVARPQGRLVWIHAVGLGEVLSARAIINALHTHDPKLSFLITSSTKVSAEVFAAHMPKRTYHQFLPLDCPQYTGRFLRHWIPNLCIWVEQDFWPGLAVKASAFGIPQVIINGRMNQVAYKKRKKWGALYRLAYAKQRTIWAQDSESAHYISDIAEHAVLTLPNLKVISPPLTVCEGTLQNWQQTLDGKQIWVVGSAHFADAKNALTAQEKLLQLNPTSQLVIIPRYIEDVPSIVRLAGQMGLSHTVTSDYVKAAVIIETTFGTLGLWYRLASCALIGGSFDETEGHNPWEAVHLQCATCHGPHVKNFQQDFDALTAQHATVRVNTHDDLMHFVHAADHTKLCENATTVLETQHAEFQSCFGDLHGYIT